MRNATLLMAALAATLVLAGCAGTAEKSASVAPLETRQTALGTVLTDETGMTLYTYKDDPPGVSECYERCARKWPPARVTEVPPAGSDLSVIERKDGIRQYAWRGKPLYGWVKDKKPGDASGHNVGEVWFVVRP